MLIDKAIGAHPEEFSPPKGLREKIAEAVKAERERLLGEIESKMQLDWCDPDTMAYFEDYYWIGKNDWQALKGGK